MPTDTENQPIIKEPSLANDIKLDSAEESSLDSNLDAALEKAGLTEIKSDELEKEIIDEDAKVSPKKPEQAREELHKKADAPTGGEKAATELAAKTVEPKKEFTPVDPDKITEPKGMNPKQQSNWRDLRESVKHYKTEAATVAEKAKKVEAELQEIKANPSKYMSPELQAEVQELRKLRVEDYTTRDPEWIKTYHAPVESSDTELLDYLKAQGMDEKTLESIKTTGIDKVPRAWWQENVINPLSTDEMEKNKFLSKLGKSFENRERLNKAMDEVKGGSTDFLKKRAEQLEIQAKQENETAVKIIQQTVDENTKDVEWAKERQIPADATPEQKAEIEADNKYLNETLKPIFGEVLSKWKEPSIRAQAALGICAYRRLSDVVLPKVTAENESLKQQLAQRDEEISKMRNIGKVSNKMRTTSTEAKAANAVTDKTNLLKMKDADAVDAGLDEAINRLA